MSQTLNEKYNLKCEELSEKKYDQEFLSGRRQHDAFTDGFNAALELAQNDVDKLEQHNEELKNALDLVLYYVQGDATWEGLKELLKTKYGIDFDKARETLTKLDADLKA